ncbi:LuxR C-terminal-related transcriptional regulator, partial [Cereibacter sphaeroides]
EREMMLERQREGIAKAKAEGKYRGRKPTALSQERKVLSLVETGMSNRQIAQAIGISERSVYRVKGGNPRHLSAAQTQASSGRDDATLRVDLERIEALTAS